LGFPSLIAAPASGVHSLRKAPIPALRSVRGVSHALDGLLRHLPCGFVSPRSHVQGLPSRGLSLARSRTGFPRPVHALLALSARACGLTRASSGALDFRALLPAASAVTSGTCLGSHPIRAPPGLSLLRVFTPRTVGTISRSLHPRPFFAASPPRPALGVSTARGTVDLGPGYRPARGFWPEPPSSFRRMSSRPTYLSDPPSRRTRRTTGATGVPRCKPAKGRSRPRSRRSRSDRSLVGRLWVANPQACA